MSIVWLIQYEGHKIAAKTPKANIRKRDKGVPLTCLAVQGNLSGRGTARFGIMLAPRHRNVPPPSPLPAHTLRSYTQTHAHTPKRLRPRRPVPPLPPAPQPQELLVPEEDQLVMHALFKVHGRASAEITYTSTNKHEFLTPLKRWSTATKQPMASCNIKYVYHIIATDGSPLLK